MFCTKMLFFKAYFLFFLQNDGIALLISSRFPGLHCHHLIFLEIRIVLFLFCAISVVRLVVVSVVVFMLIMIIKMICQ